MKTFRLLIVVAVIAAFGSCDKEPDPTPFLTIDVGFIGLDPGRELWIFANDENGQLIDIRELQKGPNYLRSVRNEISKVDLTIVEVFEGAHHFTTYRDVSTDRPININHYNPVFPISYQVDLELSNYSEGDNPYNALSIDGGFGSTGYGTYTFDNGIFKAPVAVYIDPGKLLVSGYRAGIPVYSLTSGIKTRLVLKLDFNDFVPLENLVTINDVETAYTVGHSNEHFTGGNYVIQRTPFSDPPKTSVSIGYAPGFDYYTTRVIKIDRDDAPAVEYKKVGAPITSLTWPNVSITTSDKSQENFQINCSVPVDRVTTSSYFISNSRANSWVVYGTDLSRGIPNIPPMFLARLNVSSKEVFNFLNGEIVVSGGTYTHQDFLEEKLYEGKPKKECEYFIFYFN
ncbi:MAG TPA: hypothetical protein VGD65_00870 [Chryseosolibacter sp.]